MRLHLDEKTYFLNIGFDDSAVVESDGVQLGVALDSDGQDHPVGTDILRVKEGPPEVDLRKAQIAVP